MEKSNIRVRFAPSPSGFMHLGNVRAALINYLFAKQNNGDFVLRIEDTDNQRNIDPQGQNIISNLKWLGLNYTEGPIIGGPHAPYYQSERFEIYQKYLNICIEKKLVYRCFCSTEELEQKRQRQIALKKPPRYDKSCLKLSEQEINKNLESKKYIWRFILDDNKVVHFYDMAHKEMRFALKSFSDIPLTRQDGSFTFLFANFVDDLTMGITHVFRGEDHLSNTAAQVAMYNAFEAKVPVFWHLHIITNHEGKKLSKRDFGFSLNDLQSAGYLPEAICNYLTIIGTSFEKEIQSKDELIKNIDFNKIATTGNITYDVEKLKWVNQKWISSLDIKTLVNLVKPYLQEAYPVVSDMPEADIEKIISIFRQEMVTLKDSVELVKFLFLGTDIKSETLLDLNTKSLKLVIKECSEIQDSKDSFFESMQAICKNHKIQPKDLFTVLRYACTGKIFGIGIKDLIELLGPEKIRMRLKIVLELI